MKNFKQLLVILSLLAIISCDDNRIPCSTLHPESAIIPVMVDWSISGLDPQSDDVHRLSIMLYPEGGGVVVMRFMEGDLQQGNIMVPVGSYDVIIINESVTDGYWRDAVNFVDVTDFDNFAAELVEDSDGEAAEALPIVVWSMEGFTVTRDMAMFTHGVTGVGDVAEVEQLTPFESEQLEALSGVVMSPRTRNLRVIVGGENIASAQRIIASVSGLSMKIGMVSGEEQPSTTRHTFALDRRGAVVRSGEESQMWGERVCFGHSESSTEGHALDLDVVMSDGNKYENSDELEGVDVADQVRSTPESEDYEIRHTISCPKTEGGGSIGVEDWGDGEQVQLN